MSITYVGLLVAALVAGYGINYAWHVWRREHNLIGGTGVLLLNLAMLSLSVYLLFFRN